jgi:hypothetical protein
MFSIAGNANVPGCDVAVATMGGGGKAGKNLRCSCSGVVNRRVCSFYTYLNMNNVASLCMHKAQYIWNAPPPFTAVNNSFILHVNSAVTVIQVCRLAALLRDPGTANPGRHNGDNTVDCL